MKFTKSHLLKDNKTSKLPTEFIFFDVETTIKDLDKETKEHIFRLGTALYWRRREDITKDTVERFQFNTIDKFWQWVFTKTTGQRRIILISHNLGFDFKVLKGFNTLKKVKFKITKLILNYGVNIFRFTKNDKALLFLDNLNYFKTSLKILGDSVGLRKMEMPKFAVSDQEWFKYCQRDTEILFFTWKKWLSFIKDNDLGSFGLTLPSQALNAFRHRFNKHQIYIHHKEDITKTEREAYHGGRTECFYIGKLEKSNYYCLDINSAYSYVMSTLDYPTNFCSHLKNVSVEELKEFLKDRLAIATVKITTPENVFSYNKDEKLCFPVGSFEAVLTTRELEYALSKGYVKKVLDLILYNKSPIFTGYVDFFYTKRKQYKDHGEKAFNYICKIFLNSLYGKFGQRNEVYEQVAENSPGENCIWKEYDVQEEREITYRVINGTVEKSIGFEEAYNAFPAICAHITADTRLLLYKYFKQAGSKNVFYVDTDSLFVNQQGYDNLRDEIQPGKLGKLKVERSGTALEIRGLKDYTFDKITKIKGIRKDAIKISNKKYSQWEFEGIKGSLHYNRLNTQIMKKVVKVMKRDYTKGIVNCGGWVDPFKIKDICLEEIQLVGS